MASWDPPVTREEMAQAFSYDADSGELRRMRPMGQGGSRHEAGTIAGTIENNGYRRVTLPGVKRKQLRVLAHRIAWLLHYGEWPIGQLDHKDGDKANNRIANLRDATSSQNGMNRPCRVDNALGHRGVCFSASGRNKKHYVACVKAKDKGHYFKRFRTLEEAIAARREAATALHDEFHRE
jgi:hypothetical protein